MKVLVVLYYTKVHPAICPDL